MEDPQMLRAGLIVVFAMAVSVTAMARSELRRSDAPRDSANKSNTQNKVWDKPVSRGPNACATFGPGFVKVDGSDTCVRIGGSTSVSVGSRAGAR